MNSNKPAWNTVSYSELIKRQEGRRAKPPRRWAGLQGRVCTACQQGDHERCFSKTCGCETCKIGLEE